MILSVVCQSKQIALFTSMKLWYLLNINYYYVLIISMLAYETGVNQRAGSSYLSVSVSVSVSEYHFCVLCSVWCHLVIKTMTRHEKFTSASGVLVCGQCLWHTDNYKEPVILRWYLCDLCIPCKMYLWDIGIIFIIGQNHQFCTGIIRI